MPAYAKTDYVLCALVFALTLGVFAWSPVVQMSDEKYKMLVSQSLWERGSLAVDGYGITPDQVGVNGYGGIYQLHQLKGRIYHFFPDAPAILSMPLVAVMNQFGIKATNPDGAYNETGELRLHKSVAATATALLVAVFFLTARLLLPLGWSLLLTCGGAFGTQLWSTASRGVWQHTWGVLLLGAALWLLLRHATGQRRLWPVLLASALAWAYFVRPANSLSVVVVTAYVLWQHRRHFPAYVIAGAAWGVGFVAYSRYNFGAWLPPYFLLKPPGDALFWREQLAANLFSPSRGLLIYVPAVLFVSYLAGRYRRVLPCRALAGGAAACIVVHWLLISLHWPGYAYGPRYWTDMTPWFFLLVVVSVAAWRAHEGRVWLGRRVPAVAGGLLLAAGVFVNGRGALATETWDWNYQVGVGGISAPRPYLWDWQQTQFLAGLRRKPPAEWPPLHWEQPLAFDQGETNRYLWYGWSGPEPGFRWNEGTEAAVVFSLNETGPARLEMRLAPFVLPGRVAQQRLTLALNGCNLSPRMTLTDGAPQTLSFSLPEGCLAAHNELIFTLPDAVSPQSSGLGNDSRLLGVRVEWLRLARP